MTITIILSAIVIVLYWVLIANDDETGNGKEKNIKEDKNVDSSEYLDSNTEKLLNEFDRRKKEQKRKKEERREREEKLRKVSANAIEEIIVPVLKEIEKGISKEGRLCSVNKEVEGRMYPYTELKFKPEEGFGRNSSIRFERSKPCKILMREKIKTDDFNGREASIEVDNLKAEWVKKKTNAFIKNALKQY